MNRTPFWRAYAIISISFFLGGCRAPFFDGSFLWAFCSDAMQIFSIQKHHVVARVNNYEITDEEIRQTLENYPAAFRAALKNPATQKGILEGLINQKIASILAIQAGVARDRIFLDRLRQHKQLLLANRYYEVLKADTPMTDDFVIAQYGQFYGVHAEVSYSRITLPTASAARRAEELLQSGKSFTSVARSMSIDSRAGHGGSVGWTKPERMDVQTKSIIFRLKDREISVATRTDRGFEILRRDNSRPIPPTSADLKAWRTAVETKMVQNQIAEARSTMNVEVNEEVFAEAIKNANL